jgi:serpin B
MHPFPLSRRKFLTLSGAGALAAGFGPALARACPELDEMPGTSPTYKGAAAAVNAFATDLYRHLAGPKGKEKGNLFLSPYSIELALAMTAAGARGKTLEEMEKVLHLPKEPHAAFGELSYRLSANGRDVPRSYELSVANAIWAQQGYPWEKEFLELTRKHYGAGTIEVDFARPEAARKRINEWVEKETREKIKELIPEGVIDALTRMVLTNAIYFKGAWLYPFDKKRTKDAPFTRTDGTKADVPLMSLTGSLNYGEVHLGGRTGLAVQVLELPYAGKDLSMLVFLPEKGRSVDLMASRLTAETLAAPQLKPAEVSVFLPRFKAESALSLKPVLMDLGMKSAFGNADFTGMSPKGKELYITHVLHKAFVDVNEEGTEAAAATAVVIGRKAAPKRKEFRADRPFVYAIRDNGTGAALFLGRFVGV